MRILKIQMPLGRRVYDVRDPMRADGPISEASKVLREGGLVVFPTETVYGLGASSMSERAMKRIFCIKGRNTNKPLTLHVSSVDMALETAIEVPEVFYTLTERFWPGPLTLIVKASPTLSPVPLCRGRSVGLRMPDHHIALKLIEAVGHSVAATSANISNHPPPTTAEEAMADLKHGVDMVLDGGPSPLGVPSTVLDLTRNEVRVLRVGALSPSELIPLTGPIQIATKERTEGAK